MMEKKIAELERAFNDNLDIADRYEDADARKAAWKINAILQYLTHEDTNIESMMEWL